MTRLALLLLTAASVAQKPTAGTPYEHCGDDDQACWHRNYVRLQNQRGPAEPHGCSDGWSYDPKRKECFIVISVRTDDGNSNVKSCRVQQKANETFLRCVQPAADPKAGAQ